MATKLVKTMTVRGTKLPMVTSRGKAPTYGNAKVNTFTSEATLRANIDDAVQDFKDNVKGPLGDLLSASKA